MTLTVRGEEEDLVRALGLGADDLARVEALLRRVGMESTAPLAAGRISLDLEEHTVRIGAGEPVRLTKLELRLLQMLLANAGHAVNPEQLLTQMWGHRSGGERRPEKKWRVVRFTRRATPVRPEVSYVSRSKIAAANPALGPTSMADVFVSYARSDKARVAPLVAAIEAQGWSVWWDPEIDPGQEFDRQIAAELKAAAAVLVVWTPDSVTSRWVRGEARDGADRGILVPVRFEAASLPIDVRALHTTDLDDWGEDPRSSQAKEVLRALGAIINRERAPKVAGPTSVVVPSVSAAEPARVAICVLPFTNMSGDPQQDYFSDGITEDIITELSRWHLLAVRSRSASFRYRGVAVDMKQVARELNVRFIVEGSVRRLGARIRINAQLIDSESGSHIWAEKFDRDLAELFTVQDQVVQTIVSTLVGRVHASDFERVRRKPPASLAAYECVLKGNALAWDDPDGAAEAARLFEKAIEIDPRYGLPHALLASIWQGKWRDDPSSSDALLLKASALAKRAVELDQNDSTCFALLGWVELMRRSYDLALQHVRRAVEMNPNNQWNVADMGGILLYVGQAEEALAWFKRAKEIDPYFNEPWYWRSVGETHLVLQRYQEALAAFDHSPGRSYRVAAFMAGCYARLADMEHARVSAAECLAMKPDFSSGHFMAKQPFKNPADAASLTESLRMAGLPE